jgi:tungstate transport system permease protein
MMVRRRRRFKRSLRRRAQETFLFPANSTILFPANSTILPSSMNEIAAAFPAALRLILGWQPSLAETVLLSLRISLSAVVIAAAIGLPAGAALALFRFPGRTLLVVLSNALMGLPPVVAGLVIYLLLSRSGPLGQFGLLFTPGAMIVAQFVLVAPIIAALSRQIIEDLWHDYAEQLTSLGAMPGRAIWTLLRDARFSLIPVLLAGFGRAIAEVGAIIIVGGNIDHVTRTMTTAIVLETSRGDLALALGLGIVLLALTLAINAAAHLMGAVGRQRAAQGW